MTMGPELTGRRFPTEYLQRFLADLNIATTRGPGGFEMPNLNLAPRDIAVLTAFLNAELAPQSGQWIPSPAALSGGRDPSRPPGAPSERCNFSCS